jgi:hypothetical protein
MIIGKALPDGRVAEIAPLLFGRARILVGEPDSRFYDDAW